MLMLHSIGQTQMGRTGATNMYRTWPKRCCLLAFVLALFGCQPGRVHPGESNLGTTTRTPVGAISATTIASLDSPDPAVRLATVISLGSSNNPLAVPLLTERFLREAPVRGEGGHPDLRRGIMEAVGKLGTAEARVWLMDRLEMTLKQGPGKVKYIRYNMDYSAVVCGGIRGLGHVVTADPGARHLLSSLATEEKWYGRLDAGLQEEAAIALLVVEMTEAGLKSPEQRARHLAAEVSGTGTGHVSDWARPGFRTAIATRNGAICRLLSRGGAIAKAEVEAALARTDPVDTSRSEALREILARIQVFEMNQEMRESSGNPQTAQ